MAETTLLRARNIVWGQPFHLQAARRYGFLDHFSKNRMPDNNNIRAVRVFQVLRQPRVTDSHISRLGQNIIAVIARLSFEEAMRPQITKKVGISSDCPDLVAITLPHYFNPVFVGVPIAQLFPEIDRSELARLDPALPGEEICKMRALQVPAYQANAIDYAVSNELILAAEQPDSLNETWNADDSIPAGQLTDVLYHLR
jgi:hypothetical protein